MAGLVGYGCTGVLDIDGTVMNCPAWDISDLTPLWAEVTQRGEDRRIPSLVGVWPHRRRMDVTEHALQIVIIGGADKDGTPVANAWIGLEDNINYLRGAVADPTNVSDGTRYATLTMPSGATRFAPIHVLGLRLSEAQGIGSEDAFVLAALQISIPGGAFA